MSEADAEPHWVYFLDGMMVYASPAFDCDKDKVCRFTQKTVPLKKLP